MREIIHTGEETKKLIKSRPENSHKGSFGTLCSLCGSENMTGAAFLSSLAALKSGVGLLRFSSSLPVVNAIKALLFEPVYITPEEIASSQMTAFLCGCGIGRFMDGLLTTLLPSIKVPSVFDADCINFLAANRNIQSLITADYALTPHPAEMGRLISKSPDFVNSAREEIASEYAQKHCCTVVLKGHGTVIASKDGRVFYNTSGSSALAKGGSGDVLAGLIGSLAAQGYDLFDACVLGVYLHGFAADNLAKTEGKSGVLPSELPAEIGRLLG